MGLYYNIILLCLWIYAYIYSDDAELAPRLCEIVTTRCNVHDVDQTDQPYGL